MKRRAKRKQKSRAEAIYRDVKDAPITYGYGYQIPPDRNSVEIYFDQKDCVKIASSFFEHFEKNNWRTKSGATLRNWKEAASDWIFDHHQSEKPIERMAINNLKKQIL